MSKEIDRIKLMKKINKYQKYEPQVAVNSYTSQKIKNLHKFLQNVESESNMSDGGDDLEASNNFYNKSDKKITNNKLYSRDESVKIKQLENTIDNMKLELGQNNKTLQLYKQLLD